MPKACEVIIKCNGCKNTTDKNDFILLRTAEDLGLENFSITNPKHIRALQEQYDVEKDERFVITSKGKFIHRHPDCMKKVNVSGEVCSLTLFLQLFYLSLLPDQQNKLLDYLNPNTAKPKSKLTAMGSKKENLPNFSTTFPAVATQVLLYLHIKTGSPTAAGASPAPQYSPPSFEASGLEWNSPVRTPAHVTGGAEAKVSALSESIGEGIAKVYMTPIDVWVGRDQDFGRGAAERSPLDLSIEVARGYHSSRAFSLSPSGLGSSCALDFSTPKQPLPYSGGTPFSLPVTPASQMLSSADVSVSNLWSLRESYLGSDSSRLSIKRSPEELLAETLEELFGCMAQVTPNPALHQQLFQEVVASFHEGTDLMELIEGFHARHNTSMQHVDHRKISVTEAQQHERMAKWYGDKLVATATMGASNETLKINVAQLETATSDLQTRLATLQLENATAHQLKDEKLDTLDHTLEELQKRLAVQASTIAVFKKASRPSMSTELTNFTQHYEDDDDVPLLDGSFNMLSLDDSFDTAPSNAPLLAAAHLIGKQRRKICSYRVLFVFCLIIFVVLMVEIFRFLNCTKAFGKRWDAPCPDFKH